MTGQITIRLAGPEDAARLNTALRALSRDIGDTHRAEDKDILAGGFGPDPAFRALIALDGDAVVGAAVFSPLFSTTRGGAGAYVSDFWVAAEARGSGLASRLLAAIRDEAQARWGALYLRLVVYTDNPRAISFYERIGFVAPEGEAGMFIEGAALAAIGGRT